MKVHEHIYNGHGNDTEVDETQNSGTRRGKRELQLESKMGRGALEVGVEQYMSSSCKRRLAQRRWVSC
jgi:hypothetical protein